MVYIIIYLLIELYFSLAVGSEIGFFGTVLWIFTTFIIGMGLLKNAHFSIMNSFGSLSSGRLNSETFHNSTTAYLLGAILLIVPGVFSDFLGVIAVLYSYFLQFGGTIPSIKTKDNIRNSNKQGDDNVIDVEIVEYHSRSHHKP
jgi:UPF0716 family protein affecting phage T7 exclusion